MNEHILERRRNYIRKQNHQLTPEERLDRFMSIQKKAFSLLMNSETGYDNFIRRNHHKRRRQST